MPALRPERFPWLVVRIPRRRCAACAGRQAATPHFPSAPSGESLPITRYSAPYWERRSRSIARKTSESSSTLSKIGLAILDLVSGFRSKDDEYRPLSQPDD